MTVIQVADTSVLIASENYDVVASKVGAVDNTPRRLCPLSRPTYSRHV